MTALLPQAALTPKIDVYFEIKLDSSSYLKTSQRDLWRYEFVLIVIELESRAHLHGWTHCHRRSHPCGYSVSYFERVLKISCLMSLNSVTS